MGWSERRPMSEVLYRLENDDPDWRTYGIHEQWFAEWVAMAAASGEWSPVEGRRVTNLLLLPRPGSSVD